MPLLTKLQQLFAIEEGEYGTNPGSEVQIEAWDIAVNPVITMVERAPQVGNLGSIARPGIGQKCKEVTFKTWLKGSGTAGTAPRIGDLLEACFLKETPVAETSVTYTPSSDYTTDFKSVSIKAYLDGIVHELLGAVGNAKVIMPAGEAPYVEFTFRGLWKDLADEGLETIALEATLPQAFVGGTCTIGEADVDIASLELDIGNIIANRPSGQGTTPFEFQSLF
jgi:hypothetical protein